MGTRPYRDFIIFNTTFAVSFPCSERDKVLSVGSIKNAQVMPKVYINAIAKFLPNDPVPNERMEQVLGVVNGLPSRARSIVLRNNRITSRYYAIGSDGQPTHNNAELTVQAINQLMEQSDADKREIDVL